MQVKRPLELVKGCRLPKNLEDMLAKELSVADYNVYPPPLSFGDGECRIIASAKDSETKPRQETPACAKT